MRKLPLQVFFFCGPPRSGKDTLANHPLLREQGFKLWHGKMAHHLFLALMATRTDISPWRWEELREKAKEIPQPEFLGRTMREVMIQFSEKWMKPTYGKDIFGRVLLHDITHRERHSDQSIPRALLISDSGFREEADPLINHFGAENCHIVRVVRPGYSFRGDSRSWWNHPDVAVFTLVNVDGEPDYMARKFSAYLASVAAQLRESAS